jgi:hypothetical protein
MNRQMTPDEIMVNVTASFESLFHQLPFVCPVELQIKMNIPPSIHNTDNVRSAALICHV